jgi:hypothetical protein
VFETRRLERVFDNLRHFDNALFEADRAVLLAGRVPDEARLPLRIWHVLGLGRLNLSIDKLL